MKHVSQAELKDSIVEFETNPKIWRLYEVSACDRNGVPKPRSRNRTQWATDHKCREESSKRTGY